MPSEIDWSQVGKEDKPKREGIIYIKTGAMYIVRPVGEMYEFLQAWDGEKFHNIREEDVDAYYNSGLSITTRFATHVIYEGELRVMVVPPSIVKKWNLLTDRTSVQWKIYSTGAGLQKRYHTEVYSQVEITPAEQALFEAYRKELSTLFQPKITFTKDGIKEQW